MDAPEKSVPASKSIRRKGLFRMVVGLVLFLVLLAGVLWLLPLTHLQLTGFGMVPVALPGAFALAGFLEFVTGVPFVEFARRWDQLKGWQRGVFGTAIVLVAFVVIIFAFTLFASQH